MFIIIIIVIIIVISIIIIIISLMLMLMLMLKMLIIKAEDHKAGAGDILHIHLMILHRLVPCFITILCHASSPLKSFQQPHAATQNYSNKKTWWKQFCTFRMITGWPFLTSCLERLRQGCCSRGAKPTVGHVTFVEAERSGDYPLVNPLHNYGKSPLLMGKLTINGNFQ